MLLIVGDMRNLFETPPRPPIIHLLARPAVQVAVQPERTAPAVATEVKTAVLPAATPDHTRTSCSQATIQT